MKIIKFTATSALIAILGSSTVWADGGAGGQGTSGTPGTGGTAGAQGTDGTGTSGGGGGDAMAAGGNGGGGGAGGAAGTSISTNGQNGANSAVGGAGGGGGGYNGNGTGAASLNNSSGTTVQGGNGGAGGNVTAPSNFGAGGGGGGGIGAVITGSGASSNAGTIIGGAGGAGGTGNNAGVSGQGGTGGAGISFSASGATLTNTGTITGGAGGNATGVVGGAGGAGVSGSGLTVINSGTISGGAGGSGSSAGASGNAITFTGGANVLEIQAGSVINGNVVVQSGTGTFRLGGSTNASFDASLLGPAAQYRGFTAYSKQGSSTWTLSGTNTQNIGWAVDAGILNVTGALASAPITVNAGGTLAGSGTVGAINAQSGGVISPGIAANGPTTLSVAGNVVFNSGSTYRVNVNAAGADQISGAGTANLGNASVNAVYATDAYISRRYTILSAAGGLGGTTFGSFTNTNLPSNSSATLNYDANAVYLNLALAFQGRFDANQQAVANTLTNYFNSTGGIRAEFANLGANGLTQVSGQNTTSIQQTSFNAMTMFMGAMTEPRLAGNDDGTVARPLGYASDPEPMAYASKGKNGNPYDAMASFSPRPAPPRPFVERWSVWSAGFGGTQTTDGNATTGSTSTASRIYGGAMGADYRFSLFTVAGFSLAGGVTNASLGDLGASHSDLYQVGGFFRQEVESTYLTGALAYGWQDVTNDRTLTVSGIDRLRSQFNANTLSGRVEAGQRFAFYDMGVTPYAAGQVTTIFLPSAFETSVSGANTFALITAAKDVTSPRTELGLRADKSFQIIDGCLVLRGRGAWAHDFNPDRSAEVTFQALPTASFVVNGAAQARDAALVSAGAELKLRNNWTIASTFEGELSSVTRSYAGKGGLRYNW